MQQGTEQVVTKTQLKATKATLQSVKNQEQICCRICLQQMTLSETFSVCKCKGANGHVHEKCLHEWSKKAQKYRESFDIYYYHCQICKQKILLEVMTKLRCLQCRKITFCGEDFCCTISSLVIFLMGVAMFIAGLYLKLTSSDKDIQYLFDLTLYLSAIIIIVDVVLSTMYYLLYNEVIVVGILLSEEQRKGLKKKEECVVVNSHGVENQEKRVNKKERNVDINQTQVFFMEENREQRVRNVIEEDIFEIEHQEERKQQSQPKQVILFAELQNVQHIKQNHQQVVNQNNQLQQSQCNRPIQQHDSLPSQLHHIQSFKQQQTLPQNNQKNPPPIAIPQRDFSVSTIQQYQTQSILVKSISIKSKDNYRNNLSSYGNSPMNDTSSIYSYIQNENHHNQIIIPMPNSMVVKKPNPLTKFRKTLNQSMIRRDFLAMEQRKKLQKNNHNQHQRVSEEEYQQDVEIYYPKINNGSKFQAHSKHYSSLVEGDIKKQLEE